MKRRKISKGQLRGLTKYVNYKRLCYIGVIDFAIITGARNIVCYTKELVLSIEVC